MKKILYIITLLIIGVTIVGCTSTKNANNTKNDDKVQESGNESTPTNTSRILVLYFSATGTTKTVAEKISEATNSDIIEIIPKEKYTDEDLDYNTDETRANNEQNDKNARPEISNKIDVENYDVIYLGYPIWWGTVPKIILTLLDTYDLSDKTIVPFCTSGGSSISKSISDLKEYNDKINWVDGKKFSPNVKSDEITKWINSLNISK